MIRDIKSNTLIAAAIVAATITPSTVNSAQVDHGLANSVSFSINVGAITGTVDAKLQYSADGTTWVDEDGLSGNDTAIIQLTATGTAQLNVVNPQERYSRVVVVVGGTSAVMSVTSVMGPLRSVPAVDL